MTELAPNYNSRSINPVTQMDHDLYGFSALPQRKKLQWPNGASVAMAVVVNVDYGDLAINPMNLVGFTHRDYGTRVGVFRLMGILDALDIKASMPISDVLLTRTPRVVEEARKRRWELVGHGAKVTQAVSSAMSEADERTYLEGSLATIRQTTGTAPRGWLGPGNSESARTVKLLAELGYDYTLDWGNDDQPYDFSVPQGRLSAVPYSVETSDAAVIQAQSHTPWEYAAALEDHLETLIADGEKSGMVMTLGLQANVSGQPLRAKYIRSFLEQAKASGKVWFATASEIVDAYRDQI
ncbi:MAG: polysaccharide deacetylase family protein [Candidatus Devosia phytovorans]|uniref:Chitooligosaccharide deacetylase n=1 Tax=Candidatus Devosia phytovorans TaxID=3121372 RepID=A0AAJ5VUZ0_9HYPH|nr:polysaccharide deacetylase family protein [Devosia sp.]WEK05294.1 MAG: polysaccharide deacetylase family protein [Devosia sp.]